MTEELDAKVEVKNKVEEDKHEIKHADSDMDNYSQTQNNELEIDEQYDDEIERKMTHYSSFRHFHKHKAYTNFSRA